MEKLPHFMKEKTFLPVRDTYVRARKFQRRPY